MSETELTPIPNYPGYLITRDGKIWSEKSNKWLKPGRTSKKPFYLNVILMRNGERCDCLVHRLVLETFVGPCPVGMESCHNSANVTDNRVENLRWDTSASNKADRTGLNEHKVSWIKQLLDTGRFTGAQIAKVFGVSRSVISDIKTGKHYKTVA